VSAVAFAAVATGDDSLRQRVIRYSAAQRRTADVALDLFAENGVGGTSLQMIADRLGVTKAAVYHQFHNKADIVVAVLELQLEHLESAVEQAEAAGESRTSRTALLAAMIDGVIRRRTAWRTLQSDPVFLRALDAHAPSRRLFARVFAFLLGDVAGRDDRVRSAVLSATIGAVGHPLVADVDDATLAADLLAVASALVEEPTDLPAHVDPPDL
jgi:AcrR family transcriptional regulator